MHIDGDSFFAACEVAKNPLLRGKVVITGSERGIVSACTYEGKARGVKRGMRMFEVRKLCPDAIILPSDYETYSLYSRRMYDIVRRFTPSVEEYSIDECFAEITGLRRLHHRSYADIAKKIKHELCSELGITFSVGLSVTKTLAKIGSKWHKPNGLTVIPLRDVQKFLTQTKTEAVWGIGANTSAHLARYGITTALQFIQKDEEWISKRFTKPTQETWKELRGEIVYELDTVGKQSYTSIQKTKTFTPPSKDSRYIYSQLSKNIENACIKARRWNLTTRKVHFFLKTQDFRFHGIELTLPYDTNIPQDILREVERVFMRVWKKGVEYRATGVTLLSLEEQVCSQLDLFGVVDESIKMREAFRSVDQVSQKYGKHTLYLASSALARQARTHEGERGDAPERTKKLFKGESARKRLSLPMLGEVV